VEGAIWVDIDEAFPRSPRPAELAAAFPPGASVHLPMHYRRGNVNRVWWLVCGCALIARPDATAKRLLRLWLANRCGYKDQPSLWDSLRQLQLEAQLEENCSEGAAAAMDGAGPPLLSTYNFPYDIVRKALDESIAAQTGGFRDQRLAECVDTKRTVHIGLEPDGGGRVCNMDSDDGPERYCMLIHLELPLKRPHEPTCSERTDASVEPRRRAWLAEQRRLLELMTTQQSKWPWRPEAKGTPPDAARRLQLGSRNDSLAGGGGAGGLG
jgi:hypothetical protein